MHFKCQWPIPSSLQHPVLHLKYRMNCQLQSRDYRGLLFLWRTRAFFQSIHPLEVWWDIPVSFHLEVFWRIFRIFGLLSCLKSWFLVHGFGCRGKERFHRRLWMSMVVLWLKYRVYRVSIQIKILHKWLVTILTYKWIIIIKLSYY